MLELADTVTVLRDGRLVKTARDGGRDGGLARRGDARPAAHLDVPAEARRPQPDAPVVLVGRATCTRPGVDGVSLELRAGEIVGLAGLVGAGRTELARAVFGAARDRVGRGRARRRRPARPQPAAAASAPGSR